MAALGNPYRLFELLSRLAKEKVEKDICNGLT